MTEPLSLTRTLVAALAAAALAAPAAGAAPIAEPQDLRSPDAADVADSADAPALAQERYYSTYGRTAPLGAAKTTPAAGNDASRTTLEVGLAGVCLVTGGTLSLVALRRRRTART